MHPTYELTDAGDRYFDGLADKFSRSLYQAPRGELRLAMLDYLLPQMLHLKAQPVLDVGGGLGQLSGWFAARGQSGNLAGSELPPVGQEGQSGYQVRELGEF